MHQIGQIIPQAQEALSPTTKLQTNSTRLTVYAKTEPLPECIKNDPILIEKYDTKDLQFDYVFLQCKALKPLKGVEVTLQTVEFWFKEFVKRRWTKYYFDKRLDAVKTAKTFGAFLDFNIWFTSETLYTEFEMNQIIDSKIQGKINEARIMKESGFKLTEDQEQYIKYAAAQKFMLEATHDEIAKMDELIENERMRLRTLYNTKKMQIANMTDTQKANLFEIAKLKGELKPTNEAEGNIMKKYIEDFCKEISTKSVQEALA